MSGKKQSKSEDRKGFSLFGWNHKSFYPTWGAVATEFRNQKPLVDVDDGKTNAQKLAEIKALIGDDVELKFEVVKALVDDIRHHYNGSQTLALKSEPVSDDDDSFNGVDQDEIIDEDKEIELAMAVSRAVEEERKKKELEDKKRQQLIFEAMPVLTKIIEETVEKIFVRIKRTEIVDKLDSDNEKSKQDTGDEMRNNEEIGRKEEEMRNEAVERQKQMKEEEKRKQEADERRKIKEEEEKRKREAEERRKKKEEEERKKAENKRRIEEKIKDFKTQVAHRISMCLFAFQVNTQVINDIKTLIKYYEEAKFYCEFTNLNNLLTMDPENCKTDHKLNEVSVIVLKMVGIFQDQSMIIPYYFFRFFGPLIDKIKNQCDKPVMVIASENQPPLAASFAGSFHKKFLEHFCPIQVPGDGNCLWHSVSVNLFGDRSMTESLRLLTAATFEQHKHRFQSLLLDQKTKFGYNHELTFDDLVTAALTPGVWGDEFHILALSVALLKPIYSYGSFMTITEQIGFDADYKDIKLYCQNNDVPNHFRYVGYEEDEAADPICIFYDARFHYSPIVPVLTVRSDGTRCREQPIKPKTQLLDYLFKG